MAQIKKTCSVVTGSQSVVMAGDLSTRIKKNFIFMVDGELVPYTVAADATYDGVKTTVALTGAYKGITNGTATGVFVVDFTYPDLIPTISQGDVGTAAVFTQAMYRLQDMVTSVSPVGLAAYSQMYNDVIALRDAVDASEVHVSALEQSAQASASTAAASKSAAATSETNAAASKTSAADSASSALSSKGAAATSATNAATSEKNAQTSQTAAAQSAANAATSESNALASKTAAADSATKAAASESSASASKSAAATSASNAAASENNVAGLITTAAASVTSAATSATNAATSESNAAASASDASSSKTAAAGSATTAATSATTAKNWATQTASEVVVGQGYGAKKYANDASASATAASDSAAAASASEHSAATSETQAAASASSAAASDTKAGASATDAAASATAAQASAANAATSETNAASSASSAAGSASSLQAALAAFRSTFLGRLAADPSVDGNGGVLSDGMEYFNTSTDTLRVYAGGAWADYDASAQAATTNANLAASNAAGSASAASTSETNAAARATAASTSADNAKTSETNAAASASAASTSADDAATSASTASTAAGNASTSAGTAQDWATKTDAKVSGVDYSAKYYAQLAASSAAAATTGQIQTDWNETDTASKSYILHKPTNVSAFGNDAGYITATASITGNAATATKLATPRAINGVDFDGTKAITVVDSTKEPAIAAGSASYFWKGNKTWAALASADVTGALGFTPYNATNPAGYITSTASITGTASNVTGTVAIANGGTGANTAATARANLGLANVDNTSDANKSVLSASKLTTPRAINGVPFDGTAPITINAVDSTAREPAIAAGTASYFWKGNKTWAALAAGDVTGALGFTPYSAANPAGYITANSSITGNAANVTGTVALANGGTGGATAADARANLGLAKVAASGAYSDLDGKPALAPVATSGAKADVGLGRADNTADLDKPVSTAQQAALDLKADRATTYTKAEVDAKASTSGAKSFFFASFG